MEFFWNIFQTAPDSFAILYDIWGCFMIPSCCCCKCCCCCCCCFFSISDVLNIFGILFFSAFFDYRIADGISMWSDVWRVWMGVEHGGGGGRGEGGEEGYKLAVECSNFVVTSIVAGQQQQQAKKYRGNSQWRSNIASFVGPSFCCPTWNVSFGFYGRNWNVESGERGSSGVDGGE